MLDQRALAFLPPCAHLAPPPQILPAPSLSLSLIGACPIAPYPPPSPTALKPAPRATCSAILLCLN